MTIRKRVQSWLDAVWNAARWKARAAEAEERVTFLERSQTAEKQAYAEKCERLLHLHWSQLPRGMGDLYALDLHFSALELRHAKGSPTQVARRYSAWVSERFEREIVKLLSGESCRRRAAQ